MSLGRLFGRRTYSGRVVVSVGVTGAGTATVTLPANQFGSPPAVLVIPDRGDEAAGATYSATGITAAAFTVSIAGSSIVSADVSVPFFCVEKG